MLSNSDKARHVSAERLYSDDPDSPATFKQKTYLQLPFMPYKSLLYCRLSECSVLIGLAGCALCFLFILQAVTVRQQISSPIIININTPVRNIDPKFLSITMDTDVIRNGRVCQIVSEKFIQRASPLAPAYFRVGGNSADCIIFHEDETGPCQNEVENEMSIDIDISNFTMSGKVWTDMNKFCREAGFQLIFDLNVLLRNGSRWDSSNAYSLLRYSTSFGSDIIWQLGNEPNAFYHLFGVRIDAAQLAQDYKELRALLDEFPEYNSSLLVGPEVTRPKDLGENPLKYMESFLSTVETVENSLINAVTWHQYYLNGRTATLADFINPVVLNILQKQINAVKSIAEKYMPGIPIWLTETSSAYGGGAPGLSNAFVAGFMWLDKLGMAARSGIDVVARQSLFYGNYSLLDEVTMDPSPDWWLSVLYKKLVGLTVLNVTQEDNHGFIRLYAHCSSEQIKNHSNGIVTIFGMNLKPVGNFVHSVGFSPLLPKKPYITSYILTGLTGLQSRSVLLNENLLLLKEDGSLPAFPSIKLDLKAPLYLPPYSMGFWVVHNVYVPACWK